MNYTFTPSPQKKRPLILSMVWGIAFLAIAYGCIVAVRRVGNATISVVNKITHGVVINAGPENEELKVIPIEKDPEYQMPDNDKNRMDILIMGIRGKDDPVNGGLLTDTILLFSLDMKTGRAALVSIPRDLTVRITDDRTEKINAAYAHYGIGGTKKLFSRILGVAIDNVAVVDFSAFRTLVDMLGGITITLDRPFIENQQWGEEFFLPAGRNVLNGEQALYYARSRYSTSDFDRSRRQMQVIMAIKEKATALSLSGDPLKILELVTAIRKHLETDLGIFDLGSLKNLMEQQESLGKIRRYQLTTENLLYETTAGGVYELLPRDNTLAHIKTFIGSVLSDTPILPTPTDPRPSAPTLNTPTPSP